MTHGREPILKRYKAIPATITTKNSTTKNLTHGLLPEDVGHVVGMFLISDCSADSFVVGPPAGH